MEEVDPRKMVSSLAESIHEYGGNFSEEEELFVKHCGIKLDNDEQLNDKELYRLCAFYQKRGIEMMRQMTEMLRLERENYERK